MSDVTVISAPAPCTFEEMCRRAVDVAVDDLRHARYAEEGGFYPQACFSAQQAARAIAGASAILTAVRQYLAAL